MLQRRSSLDMSHEPTSLENVCMSVLESYVVLMYGRGSDETTVDSARKHMFTSKARSIDTIPPTRAALLQHARRATYQGGHVWGQAQVRDPDLPSPQSWGWSKNPTRGWEPMWTLLPEAAVYQYHMTELWISPWTWPPLQQANIKAMVLCALSSSEMVFSQLLQLIILTTIPARTRFRMHIMAQ